MPHKVDADRRAYMRAYYQAHREEQIARAKAWNEAHPGERSAARRKWYAVHGAEYREAHRDQLRAANRAWDAAHPEKTRADNRTQRLRRYGLTHAQYDAMLEAQGGVCGLCGKVETHRGRNGEVSRLAVDHDHVTGSIRALLCHSCNTGVGLFLDDPALLRRAADYIEGARR